MCSHVVNVMFALDYVCVGDTELCPVTDIDNVSDNDLANFSFKNHLGTVLGTYRFCCLPWEEGNGHLDDPWDEALKKALCTV